MNFYKNIIYSCTGQHCWKNGSRFWRIWTMKSCLSNWNYNEIYYSKSFSLLLSKYDKVTLNSNFRISPYLKNKYTNYFLNSFKILFNRFLFYNIYHNISANPHTVWVFLASVIISSGNPTYSRSFIAFFEFDAPLRIL